MKASHFKKICQQKIKKITQNIIREYKPEKIILFGSTVWGKFSQDSDLDFLIIKKDVPYYGIDRMRQVRNLINPDFPCDFLVVKPSEIKKRLYLEDPFIEQIMTQGKVLYG